MAIIRPIVKLNRLPVAAWNTAGNTMQPKKEDRNRARKNAVP
jgi:hypothetical protein